MTKAQIGDLIRIIGKHPKVTAFGVGGIYEVIGYSDEGTDDEQVIVSGIDDREGYVDHHEYEIHRKAGEEDSDDVDALLTEHYTDMALDLEQEPEGKYRIVNGVLVTDESEQAVRIRQAGAELTDLLVRKNHDYGDSFAQQYAKYGLMSALIRMDDKMRRLETLLDSEEQAQVSESLSDTLLDLAGYALLAYVETQKK